MTAAGFVLLLAAVVAVAVAASWLRDVASPAVEALFLVLVVLVVLVGVSDA